MILSAHGDPNLNPELARLLWGTNRTHHGVLVVNKSELRHQAIPQVIEIISE